MKHIETILIKHRFNYIEQKMVSQGKNVFFHLKPTLPRRFFAAFQIPDLMHIRHSCPYNGKIRLRPFSIY